MSKREFTSASLSVFQTVFWIAVCGIFLSAPALADLTARTLEARPLEYSLQDKISSLSESFNRPDERDALNTFYANRQYRPLWVDDFGPTRAALRLIGELERAEDWGLDVQSFKLEAVYVPLHRGRWTAAQAAAAEHEISTAILRYARQARGGRITEPARMLSSYLDRRPSMLEPALILAMIAASSEPDGVLRSFHPPHEQFHKLQAIYRTLRAQQKSADAAERVPEKGPLLMPGQKHADVVALRNRLAVPASGADPGLYDDALVAAVEKFQVSESLKSDGIVGLKTRKALNAGVGDKIKSIRANMEQWRWMPEDLGATHVFVNLPAFTAKLVQDGAVTFEERVIVGKGTTQTPVFSRKLTSVVLKPLWQLPESIKVEKLIDAQRRGSSIEDEGYVIKKGEKIVESRSVDWSKAELTAYTFFQPSGEGNALGRVKFLFPNKHSVYVHDTPNRSLFDASERLYSHGCVRLRNPLNFAQRLLNIAQGANAIDVKGSVEDGPENNQVALENPIPIHLGYFTVWVDENGAAEYHGDPYGHEERVALALENKWAEIDKGGDHLASVDKQKLKTVSLEPTGKTVALSNRVARSEATPVQAKRRLAPAMGVTGVVYFPKFKPARIYASAQRVHRVTAGDLMRQAFGR